MRFTIGLLAAAIACAASPAIAADDGFYVGVGMGYSQVDINKNKLNRKLDEALPAPWFVDGSSTDETATPYTFIVGYRILPYLAAEVSYIDMGSADYKAHATTPAPLIGSATIKGNWSADGWPLSLLGIWPVNETWEVFGRAGLFMGSVDLTARAVDNTTDQQIARESTSNNSNEFIWGLGVNANFMDVWTARFEYQAMPSVGNNDTGSASFDNLLFSVLYRF